MYIINCPLDSLQVYFPWDDDLYTYLKGKGLMTRDASLKALPLIYSDNTLSTQGISKVKRNYIVKPERFDQSLESLGWELDKKNKYIIPGEIPQIKIDLIDDNLKLSIIGSINGQEQYHLEYSIMSAFGKLYSNWVGIYFNLDIFKKMISKLQHKTKIRSFDETIILNNEKKMQQREQMYWAYVPIKAYIFSLGNYKYLSSYLRKSGVSGSLPSLEYNNSDSQLYEIMKPFLKLGYVETKGDHGFWTRKPQIVLKLAQDKIIIGQRGKKIKVKGIIKDGLDGNYLLFRAKDFVEASLKILSTLEDSNSKHP